MNISTILDHIDIKGGRSRPRKLLTKLQLPHAQHVAWQLAFTYQAIEAAKQKLGSRRFMDLPYEPFCRQPEQWLERVDDFLKGQGIRVVRRAPLERSFDVSDKLDLSPDEVSQIENIFGEAWPLDEAPL